MNTIEAPWRLQYWRPPTKRIQIKWIILAIFEPYGVFNTDIQYFIREFSHTFAMSKGANHIILLYAFICKYNRE